MSNPVDSAKTTIDSMSTLRHERCEASLAKPSPTPSMSAAAASATAATVARYDARCDACTHCESGRR